jgi:hypothetical protein
MIAPAAATGSTKKTRARDCDPRKCRSVEVGAEWSFSPKREGSKASDNAKGSGALQAAFDLGRRATVQRLKVCESTV